MTTDIDNLTDDELLRLRDALTVKASVVYSCADREITVSRRGDKIGIKMEEAGSGWTIFLTNFAAEALARDLIQCAVRTQYEIEAEGGDGDA